MSFGSLEVASIPRTQDYTTMKQNEDNKGAFQQMTLGEHAQKQSEQRTREVHSSDNADWYTGISGLPEVHYQGCYGWCCQRLRLVPL